MKKKNIILSILALGLFYLSCTDDVPRTTEQLTPVLPEIPYDYLIDNEDRGNELSYNRLTNNGATLGRVLFYDKQLSLHNNVSCATCHKQEFSFADNLAFSLGSNHKVTKRNSPTIINMKFSNRFFWDFSVNSLEAQVTMPIQNHFEMGIKDLGFLEEKLSKIEYYPELFKKAFGSENITTYKIQKALAQFVRTVSSVDTKLDQFRAGDILQLSDLENKGMEIFLQSNCNSCHTVFPEFGCDFCPPFGGPYGGTGKDIANIGLDIHYTDHGFENGKFKVPSLRNLKYTAPYMHDGRFASLDEVIEHYNSGVENHEFLDFRLKNPLLGQPKRLNLTTAEKLALKAFLLTLTDEEINTDVRFSDPFQ